MKPIRFTCANIFSISGLDGSKFAGHKIRLHKIAKYVWFKKRKKKKRQQQNKEKEE